MNHSEVVSALESVLDPESEPFKQAHAKYRDLPAEVAESVRAHQLAPTMVQVLSHQPEYVDRPNLMLAHDNGASGLQPSQVASRLIVRAKTVGAKQAVVWLEKILNQSCAAGFRVMPTWGIECSQRISLAPDVDLLPFEHLPPSAGHSWHIQ